MERVIKIPVQEGAIKGMQRSFQRFKLQNEAKKEVSVIVNGRKRVMTLFSLYTLMKNPAAYKIEMQDGSKLPEDIFEKENKEFLEELNCKEC